MRTILLLTLILFLTVSCKSHEDSSDKKRDMVLNKHFETNHFIYHFSDNDKLDTVFQEKYYSWLVDKLDLKINEKINYYKFKDRKQMKETLGFEIKGFADAKAVYSVYPSDNHELVHLLTYKTLGYMPSFLNEGFAITNQMDLENDKFVLSRIYSDYNLISKYYLNNNKIPTLTDFFSVRQISELDELIAYPIAGSFVDYLIGNYSLNKFKNLIINMNKDLNSSDLDSFFQNIYGKSIVTIWEEWKKYLEGYKPDINVNEFYKDWIKSLEK